MDAHTSENLLPASVGEILRDAREKMGISLATAANHLRINVAHLTKLESNHETLTSDVYTLGFLKLYAQYLNLNASALLQQFKDQITALPSSEFIFPTPLPEQGTPHVRIVLISLTLFILLAAGVGYHYWWKSSPPSSSLLDVLPQSLLLTSKAAKTAPAPSAISPATPVSPPVVQEALPAPVTLPPLLLKTTEKTWVEVRDDQDTIVLRRLFSAGETYELANTGHLVLTTGNANGLEIISGENVLTFPGVQVKRGISLDPATWTKAPNQAPLPEAPEAAPVSEALPPSAPSSSNGHPTES